MCLLVEKKNGVAWLTLDRPEKHNALNAALLKALSKAFESLASDSTIGVVILKGSGDRAFAAGGDIAEFQGQDAASALLRARTGQALINQIEGFPKPVIAAVNGWALGGGCELALACHIRIASGNARFGLPEASLGLIPGYGGTQRLSRLVGRGVALDMILTGEPVLAAQALQMGLVSRVLPEGELEAEAERMAGVLLSRAPQALSAVLACVHQGLDLPLAQGLELEAGHFSRVAETPDAREGTNAFLEKRKPRFRGDVP